MTRHFFLFIFIFVITTTCFSQSATIQGIVLDENNSPIPQVNINTDKAGTTTNANGYYTLKIKADTKTKILFSHLSKKPVEINIVVKNGSVYEFHPVLKQEVAQIQEVVVTATKKTTIEGVTSISARKIRLIPGANPGVENILKSLPGVNSNNELSSQYAVRGGNFDENLVYVNGIEVYRPFLVRSGQQEGLSFVNADMVRKIDFSAGGFQAKYGDKLSSVLDITYKKPVAFGLKTTLHLLGANATLETISKNTKFSSITGFRYRDNSLLVNSKEVKTNFSPVFLDLQSNLNYRFSEVFSLDLLTNISSNAYTYTPISRETTFGTLQDPKKLIINYQGQEKDRYTTAFGALKANYVASKNIDMQFIGSMYQTTEQEHADILAAYLLKDAASSIGGSTPNPLDFNQGIGTQLNHIRNNLEAVITSLSYNGQYHKNKSILQWGLQWKKEHIKDRVVEWELLQRNGYASSVSLDAFREDQPYTPYTAEITPFQSIRARNNTTINRFLGFTQWSQKKQYNQHKIWYAIGLRAQHWQVNQGKSQFIWSPRAQFSIKPNWRKDMIFKLAVGAYHQAPFYKELRDLSGNLRPEVKAQKSMHIILGNTYSFLLGKNKDPFTLNTELYYKKHKDVNPYTVDNVRINYSATNTAKAYAYGIDMRLSGGFVPGTDSWVSLGFLKTQENDQNKGYIARPTDQRFKFGMLFQDYVPSMPNLKMYLNMVYNTGLPGGSAPGADPYLYQNRLNDYKRADLGVSYILTDSSKRFNKGHWLHPFKELTFGLEIFNLFNTQNAITNTWVRDVYNKTLVGIPNYMTSRVFNIKLHMEL